MVMGNAITAQENSVAITLDTQGMGRKLNVLTAVTATSREVTFLVPLTIKGTIASTTRVIAKGGIRIVLINEATKSVITHISAEGTKEDIEVIKKDTTVIEGVDVINPT
jgi:F420-dependent methylenetetrahydromethanopterin dehydrogenase